MANEIKKSTSNDVVLSIDSMSQITHFANLMAEGRAMLPEHLQGKPADCMAVALQAVAWNMSPFVVAQKTHLVNGTLGYEAQLVNAVISSSRAIVGRFHYRTIGNWENWKYQAKKITKNGKNGAYQVDTHGGVNEQGLAVQVGAILQGESEITWDDPLYIENIVIRNSPLWQSRPLQQMKYLAVKYWARIYCPEVILGVYTPDELTEPEKVEREINPIQKRAETSIDDIFNESDASAPIESDSSVVADSSAGIDDIFNEEVGMCKFEELMTEIKHTGTLGDLLEVGNYVSQAKESGEITEEEALSLKVEYQKRKNRL